MLGYIKELNNEDMNMITVLNIFFCSKERSLANMDEWKSVRDGKKATVVESKPCIPFAVPLKRDKAAKLCEAGAEYHRRLKRKYEKLLLDESEEEDTMEQPEEVSKRKAKKVPLSKEELDYIATFRNQTTNRKD
ncbi:hypothetical protein INT48_007676 [Thamnidium elegans]|uniref:Uncharacterized protein n=1 Tax=Thamnidium elegans TaxID=101142 RepID=A0A8H7VNM8_9FUNG|nr:hypothetical protein INT48_007676 [Thamnidium elegans]